MEKTVTNSEAGKLQMNASQFDCKIVQMEVLGGGNARIKIEGNPDKIQQLFDYITEAGYYENKETKTV